MTQTSQEVTKLLADWSCGDQTVPDKLMPLVYEELRRLAHLYMRREKPGHTLQTSALVNEAYVRLVDQNNIQWESRAHFFGIAARLMRQILVDQARRRNAKRGGGAIRVSLNEATIVAHEQSASVMALDDALKRLEEIDPRKSRIVELRFFGGMSIEETAATLGVSPGTVMRDWTFIRAWLRKEMEH
ncbi:MAG: sigma-70 family RNA polymerase sigma factor [Pyrinomonadaceae bacterium]|nr:sigma-70 family RNA polymerase sigma factor [Pyrinomonadaceae bacterium]